MKFGMLMKKTETYGFTRRYNMDQIPPKEAELKVKQWPKDTIPASCAHTLGLKSDGTVVAVGDNEFGQCDVSGWRGIQLPGNDCDSSIP
jgi:NADH:ubiquinone oxidoreductase subunit